MTPTTTKRLCRAGIIAALYAALTYAFMPIAFGPLQLRPAEALCLLPLFFPEAIPALWIGCILSNLSSPYFVYDVLLGSLCTLVAAFGTYMVGRFLKGRLLKYAIGGLFPVLINALTLPLILLFLCGVGTDGYALGVAYFAYAGMLCFTQTLCVYGIGAPLYFSVHRLRGKLKFLMD